MNRHALLAVSLVITQPSAASTIAESTGLVAQPPAGPEQIVEHYQGWSCASPFYTLAEGRMAADAILHVRLDYQVTYDHAIVAPGDLEGFEVLNFEEGALQILDAKVAGASRGSFAETWRGQAASAFLSALATPARPASGNGS